MPLKKSLPVVIFNEDDAHNGLNGKKFAVVFSCVTFSLKIIYKRSFGAFKWNP